MVNLLIILTKNYRIFMSSPVSRPAGSNTKVDSEESNPFKKQFDNMAAAPAVDKRTKTVATRFLDALQINIYSPSTCRNDCAVFKKNVNKRD